MVISFDALVANLISFSWEGREWTQSNIKPNKLLFHRLDEPIEICCQIKGNKKRALAFGKTFTGSIQQLIDTMYNYIYVNNIVQCYYSTVQYSTVI